MFNKTPTKLTHTIKLRTTQFLSSEDLVRYMITDMRKYTAANRLKNNQEDILRIECDISNLKYTSNTTPPTDINIMDLLCAIDSFRKEILPITGLPVIFTEKEFYTAINSEELTLPILQKDAPGFFIFVSAQQLATIGADIPFLFWHGQKTGKPLTEAEKIANASLLMTKSKHDIDSYPHSKKPRLDGRFSPMMAEGEFSDDEQEDTLESPPLLPTAGCFAPRTVADVTPTNSSRISHAISIAKASPISPLHSHTFYTQSSEPSSIKAQRSTAIAARLGYSVSLLETSSMGQVSLRSTASDTTQTTASNKDPLSIDIGDESTPPVFGFAADNPAEISLTFAPSMFEGDESKALQFFTPIKR